MKLTHILLATVCSAILFAGCGKPGGEETRMSGTAISESMMANVIDTLRAMHGESAAERIERGVRQTARLWRVEDGTETEFLEFCQSQFIADPDLLDQTFERLQHNFMLLWGYYTEMRRDLTAPLQLDQGTILPVDLRFGEFSPAAHAVEDLFSSKIAFTVLLNYPEATLQDRLDAGDRWSRRQWAETRMTGDFRTRVPSVVNQERTAAYTNADHYISNYNIVMHHVVTQEGVRLFPDGLKLISHWGLRDELKAQYAKPDGLPRQRLIQRIMEHIIRQDIPAAVIDNPQVDWWIDSNAIAPTGGTPGGLSAAREEDTRYRHWLEIFHAERKLDEHTPESPTLIARRFNDDREIPEENVEELLVSVLSAPEIPRIATIIRDRLGRDLEPFDIWYSGLKSRPSITEDELDRIVGKKYPTVESFERDIPFILSKLGFRGERARFLASKISVDPSRGAGHAMGPGRLVDNARLRTRVPRAGMNYKGYNIAIHELGHNVEQVMSFQLMDYPGLRGVPNTAFTEGFAFVFQSRDLALLGLRADDHRAQALNALDVLWSTYEIAGVALVDMRVWRWLYEHPAATPAELREAVIGIAKEIWNEYYAPVFGVKDVPLLAIYSHMIDAGMYTPDYPLGHIIAFQIEQYLDGKVLGDEMERMCRIGRVTPDLWMRTAVGTSISTKPLLDAARAALEVMARNTPD
ncbi:MAG: hypothetical protein RBU27_08730 [Bacteroidota bacterium]|jgi:hypothetical protein|nr:hypothetical protein [Bacteroidota bacterium]